MTDWRQQQALERARQREEARLAREKRRQDADFAARCEVQRKFIQGMPTDVQPQAADHDCPPHCHRCPDMKGEVLPFCAAVAMALDWEDLSVCTCHDTCTCGNPSHEYLCECAGIPLFFRQLGIVCYADRERERARAAVVESKRRQNIIRHARRVADSLIPLTRSLAPSVRSRVDELVRLLHQTSDDVLDETPQPPPVRGRVVKGEFK